MNSQPSIETKLLNYLCTTQTKGRLVLIIDWRNCLLTCSLCSFLGRYKSTCKDPSIMELFCLSDSFNNPCLRPCARRVDVQLFKLNVAGHRTYFVRHSSPTLVFVKYSCMYAIRIRLVLVPVDDQL